MKVRFFFRKKSLGFNSIETLFSGLISNFDNFIETESFHVPSSRASIIGICKNCLFVFRNRKSLVHVTGHVNYLSIFSGKKTVLTIHDIGSSINRKWPYSVVFKYLWIKLPIHFSKRVTVISEFTRGEVLKLCPNSADKIKVIPNPVNSDFIFNAFDFNSVFPKILVVGTKANKNLERIILAIAGLNCELIILGKLNSKQNLLLEKYAVAYINKFDLSLEEVVKVYQECDLLCFPSTYEGFGLPILEAQATGRPVLTSDFGAMKEVAGNSACLIDPFDVKAIRNGVDRIIEDSEYRQDLIQKGLENVKKYSLENIAQKYYSVYKEVESE